MTISSRRVLLVATITGGMLLGGAAPAFAQPNVDLDDVTGGGVTDQVSDLPLPAQQQEGPLQQEEGPLEPVNALVCELTGIGLLGSCVEEVVPEPGHEKPAAPGKGVSGKEVGHEGVGGGFDDAVAPVGGVETGAGGTAENGAGLLLPLSALGGAALTGGAIAGARRFWSSQVG